MFLFVGFVIGLFFGYCVINFAHFILNIFHCIKMIGDYISMRKNFEKHQNSINLEFGGFLEIDILVKF